ncbi:MAG TPA: DUF3303 family protein [bacterium]|nr:DUF3303 family protein [bacterium]
MRFLIHIPDLDGFLYERHCRDDLSQALERFQALRATGLLLDGGLFADDRGGFLVMEGENQAQVEEVLSSFFDLDRVALQVHPVVSLGQIGSLFQEIQREDPTKGKAFGIPHDEVRV